MNSIESSILAPPARCGYMGSRPQAQEGPEGVYGVARQYNIRFNRIVGIASLHQCWS